MCALGWKSLGVLELTALPSIKKEHWVAAVEEVDALLVWGGSPLYLCYWMRQSGLADLLPSLRPEAVYVGTSGGAMVATPDFGGETYDDSEPLTGSDEALGLVDFSRVSAPGAQGHAGHAPRRHREMGRRAIGAGLRDRRPDRDTSGRRQRRNRLRGTLEAVHPQPRSELIGQETRALGCASVLSPDKHVDRGLWQTLWRVHRNDHKTSVRRQLVHPVAPGLQNLTCGVVAPRSVGSTPAPLRGVELGLFAQACRGRGRGRGRSPPVRHLLSQAA